MKKHSKLSLGAFWAVVMIFAAVQFVSAAVVNDPLHIEGIITSMSSDGLVIASEEEDGTITVNGMGPASYWASEEVAFPRVGDDVEIVAYLKDDLIRYVAAKNSK